MVRNRYGGDEKKEKTEIILIQAVMQNGLIETDMVVREMLGLK